MEVIVALARRKRIVDDDLPADYSGPLIAVTATLAEDLLSEI